MKNARQSKGYRMGGEAETKVFKDGGPMRKSSGGTIYEREMDGETPSHKFHHFNYEGQMRGEHPMHRAEKFAAGGVGKIRHQQATASGKPIHKHDSKVKVY